MRHPNLASPDGATLLIIDIQEKLFRLVAEQDRLVDRVTKLIAFSRILGIPLVVTEQYSRGLGPTIEPLRAVLAEVPILEKLSFSCFGADGFEQRLRELATKQLIVCGIEAHICVQQTTLDALQHGYKVHVVSDAVSSRDPENCRLGVEKMRQAGAIITSWEMVAYELMGRAGTPQFREALPLFK